MVCIDCAKLPKAQQPRKPRKIDKRSGPRSQRCREHYTAKRDAEKARRHEKHVVDTYGLEPGEYERLYLAQGGKCWFQNCKATGEARNLTVDHDHVTGEVRGLVCKGHNYYLLGWYKNDLHAALDYLRDPPYRRWKEGRDLW